MNMEQLARATHAFPLVADRIPPYPASSHRRILQQLRQDLAAGRHLLCVIAPHGSGKTRLLHELQRDDTEGLVCLIPTPTPGPLLSRVAEALGLDASGDPAAVRRRLALALAALYQRPKPVILLIDDADKMPVAELDQLFHFFPPTHACVVLAGKSGLSSIFDSDNRPFGVPRADSMYQLAPLTDTETAAYIRHRLHYAEFPADLFDAAAVASIHAYSGGLPLRINRLCCITLIDACRFGRAQITAEHIHAAAARVPTGTFSPAAATPAPAVPGQANAASARRAAASPPIQAPEATDTAAAPAPTTVRRARVWQAAALLAAIAFGTLVATDSFIGWLDLDHDRPRHGMSRADAGVNAGTDNASDFAALHAPGSGAHGQPLHSDSPAAQPRNPIPTEQAANADSAPSGHLSADRDDQSLTDFYVRLARLNLHRGKPDVALASAEQGLMHAPGNPQLLELRTTALREMSAQMTP